MTGYCFYKPPQKPCFCQLPRAACPPSEACLRHYLQGANCTFGIHSPRFHYLQSSERDSTLNSLFKEIILLPRQLVVQLGHRLPKEFPQGPSVLTSIFQGPQKSLERHDYLDTWNREIFNLSSRTEPIWKSPKLRPKHSILKSVHIRKPHQTGLPCMLH